MNNLTENQPWYWLTTGEHESGDNFQMTVKSSIHYAVSETKDNPLPTLSCKIILFSSVDYS